VRGVGAGVDGLDAFVDFGRFWRGLASFAYVVWVLNEASASLYAWHSLLNEV